MEVDGEEQEGELMFGGDEMQRLVTTVMGVLADRALSARSLDRLANVYVQEVGARVLAVLLHVAWTLIPAAACNVSGRVQGSGPGGGGGWLLWRLDGNRA